MEIASVPNSCLCYDITMLPVVDWIPTKWKVRAIPTQTIWSPTNPLLDFRTPAPVDFNHNFVI